MGLLDRLLGRSAERLPRLPEEARILEVGTLAVRTAEGLVVLTVDRAGARALVDACADRAALQLRGPGRNVTVVSGKRAEKIVLDPQHGWVIPVTAGQSAEVAALPPEPGEHDLDWVAIVVE